MKTRDQGRSAANVRQIVNATAIIGTEAERRAGQGHGSGFSSLAEGGRRWKIAIDIWNCDLPLPMTESADLLEGAWQVSKQTAADGAVMDPSGPGQFIFSDGRYSAVYTVGTQERPLSAESFNPTDAIGSSMTLVRAE